MKVGIYGGSFNPFHEGHLKVIENVLEDRLVDEVWIVPCKRNPLKKDYEYWTDDKRLESIWDKVGGLINVRVMLNELENGKEVTYTSETLKEFSEKYPQHRFCLIIGADEWMVFNKWKRWGWIIDNFKIYVHPRHGWDYDDSGFENVKYLKDFESINMSATEIRNKTK